MLKIEQVGKAFNAGTINEKVAVKGLDLTINDGDFITVIGGNGAGKSTMLNLIAGVYSPTRAASAWTTPTSPGCRNTAAPPCWGVCSRTR